MGRAGRGAEGLDSGAEPMSAVGAQGLAAPEKREAPRKYRAATNSINQSQIEAWRRWRDGVSLFGLGLSMASTRMARPTCARALIEEPLTTRFMTSHTVARLALAVTIVAVALICSSRRLNMDTEFL